MSWWEGVLLGVVQGLTEFLPISSSGHLVVVEAALGIATPGVVIEVVLHVATLLAVVIVYRKVLWRLAGGAVVGDRAAWRYIALLAIGTVPAALAGLFLEEWFERTFQSLLLVGLNFLITGAVLWSTRGRVRHAERPSPSTKGAFGIGMAQALAILPGISRSGTTVAAALWLGVDPVRAAEFSFLLAIPAIAGAAVLQIPNLSGGLASGGAWPVAAGFLAALISGVVAIRLLIYLLRNKAFHRFAPYCWGIGAITILFASLGM
ncbi:MAG: undecaprenyl-diphosphate phosphatase [Acidimicrobiia bacterium]